MALREHRELQKRKKFVSLDWQGNDLIFTSKVGTPLDHSNMRLDCKRVLERAGVQNIRFPDLRHKAASLMLNTSVPVIIVSRIFRYSKKVSR